MDASKRRKRKAYITSSNPNKRRKSNSVLVPGMRGFICTCNGYEKGCIREALNILDEYDLKLNPPGEGSTVNEEVSDADDDIEKQLKEEIKDAKKADKKFKVIDTGANNCLFISSKAKNVLELSEKIMRDAREDALAKSRFLIRLVPIEVTCKAYNEDIKKAAESIFDAHFKCDPVSYCIHVNKRSNNNLLRMEVTDDLARLVRDRNIKHTVDLKKPTKTVVVEIIRNICCLSVVNHFFEFRKYNLIELKNAKTVEPKIGSSNEGCQQPSTENTDSVPEKVEEGSNEEEAQESNDLNLVVSDDISKNEKLSDTECIDVKKNDSLKDSPDTNGQEK